MEAAYSSTQLENQWIDRARSGDLLAFNQLVLSHQDSAFRIANWMVQDGACAEDIVQTVFLAAFRQLNRLRGYHFRPWLLKMIHNACIDELRRRKRHPCLALDPLDSDGEALVASQWAVNTSPTPEETLIQHETRECIEHCIQLLPESMRGVVILTDIERLDYAESASILGIPLGTVKSRLGRARARMRFLLRELDLVAEGRKILTN